MNSSDGSTATTSSRALLVYLSALVGREPSGLLEVRWRHGDGMKRRVYRVGDELGAAAAAIVVRSGSGENRHAYWTLSGPIGVEEATASNRRLAHALGADAGAVTMAATILRPPGTANFKHTPPVAVVAERMQPWRRVSARRLVGELDDPPTLRAAAGAARCRVADVNDDQALRQVTPAVYVQALTGLSVGRDGKVSCPFHGEDRTPSLHVYEHPSGGWYCYGCGRGGSIFDLGAEVFGLSTRGRDFIELRTRLQAALAAWAPTAPARKRADQAGGDLAPNDRDR